jgi:hypothetical protein
MMGWKPLNIVDHMGTCAKPGNTYPSRPHGFASTFWWRMCCSSFLVFCVVFFLRPVSYVSNVALVSYVSNVAHLWSCQQYNVYTFILVYYNWCIWYKTDAGWNCWNDGLEAIEHRTRGQRRHHVQRKSICEYLINTVCSYSLILCVLTN